MVKLKMTHPDKSRLRGKLSRKEDTVTGNPAGVPLSIQNLDGFNPVPAHYIGDLSI